MKKKVIIHVNPMFNPLGIRMLLSDVGVSAPMLQQENDIHTFMTEQEIDKFKNGRGAAHGVEIVPEPEPEKVAEPQVVALSIAEPLEAPESLDGLPEIAIIIESDTFVIGTRYELGPLALEKAKSLLQPVVDELEKIFA